MITSNEIEYRYLHKYMSVQDKIKIILAMMPGDILYFTGISQNPIIIRRHSDKKFKYSFNNNDDEIVEEFRSLSDLNSFLDALFS